MQVMEASAKMYYDFLEANDLALESVLIYSLSVQGLCVNMHIRRTPFVDSLLLCVDNQYHSLFDLHNGGHALVEYDDNNGTLIIDFDEHEQALVHKIKTKKVSLFNDLKFLVESVHKFYKKRGEHCIKPLFNKKRLAHITSMLPPSDEIPYYECLDLHQNSALKTVFSNPISYIWGPPGSGKTKGVLLQSLLFLLAHKKRVLLLAPTNNALEQILNGILPEIEKKQYPIDCVFRLGFPSQMFLAKYPMCCDSMAFGRKKAHLFMNFKGTKQRLKEAFILAMTVDGFIQRHEHIKDIEHIFLDEAPYTPLIKALTLGYYESPLTLLGDHKQLGPICEANASECVDDKDIIKAWHFSSIYAESYHKHQKKLFDTHNLLEQEPEFDNIACACLLQNYRYGQNLTDLLDSFVYHIGLLGQDEPTQICYIDSGKSDFVKGSYCSQNEANAIKRLIPKLRYDDFVILTPFRAQRKLILDTCAALRDKDKIFTIHRSQGLEFDTVILSPVMLHYHLTDSRNISALYALNVAVSRAKKTIIIVCDVMTWKRNKGQFITYLLDNASPYTKTSTLSIEDGT